MKHQLILRLIHWLVQRHNFIQQIGVANGSL